MMRSQPRFRSCAAFGSRKASTAPKRESGEDCASNTERGVRGRRQEAKMPTITATTKSPNCPPLIRCLSVDTLIPRVKLCQAVFDRSLRMIVKQTRGLVDVGIRDHRLGRRQRRVFDNGLASDEVLDDL